MEKISKTASSDQSANNDQQLQRHYRVCNYCEAMCGVEVTYDPTADTPEKRISVKADARDPFSKGSMCPKASALGPLHYDSNKLRQPVKRVGTEWTEISWNEAYSTIADNVKLIRERHGPNAISTYLGNPIVHNLGMLLFVKTLTKAIGSKNVYSATSMDQLPHHFVAHYMYGHEFRIPVPDIDRTDFMIIMGANPVASNGSIMTSAGVKERLQKIQKRGGKFIVIDPRKTETGKIASEHHFIKPGTDVYFLAAFLHIIFRDSRVKLGRLEQYINGFQQLNTVVQDLSPEIVAPVVGINATNIERLAQEYLNHKRAVLYGRMGLSTQPHGGLCHWLIACINIASGQFDRPGGLMFPSPAIELVRSKKQEQLLGRWTSRTRGLPEFYGELPVSSMTEELQNEEHGHVKGFVTICGNPVLSTPGGKRLDEALANVEFMFSIDNYINETTRHANIILPTPSGLEIDHYDLIFNIISVANNAKFSPALFPPSEDRPYDWQILKELAHRISPSGLSLFDRLTTPRRMINLGLMFGAYGKLSHPKRWFSGLSLKKLIDSKHGISLGPLHPRIPEGLTTTDKKIHIAPEIFLSRLHEISATELPALRAQTKDKRANGSFALIGRRNVNTNNSWMHQVKHLSRSKQVRCTAMIHPVDAEQLDVRDGEDVRVTSRVGDIVIPVEVSDTMMPGVVSIPHGFGHTRSNTKIPNAEAKPGVSVNDITDHMRVDALTSNAAFSGLPLKLERLQTTRRQAPVSGKPLVVLVGSQSGNAEMVARDVSKAALDHGLVAKIVDMDDAQLEELSQTERILVICSTHGDGDMPDNAERLWEEINTASAPTFDNTHYSVLALGDLSYETFCDAGRNWDQRLAKLGSMRIHERIDCDVDYTIASEDWTASVLPKISNVGDQNMIVSADEFLSAPAKQRYNRNNPLTGLLKVKRRLNKHGSTKDTQHYEVSLAGKDIRYDVGDVINILPRNRRELVDEVLALVNADGNEPAPGQSVSLHQHLTHNLEIRTPSRRLLKAIAEHGNDTIIKALLDKSNPNELTAYLWSKDVVDLLRLHPGVFTEANALIDVLSPLEPRSYSISSSLNVHADEVHITVATVRYDDNGRQHHGVGSTYLADQLEPGDEVKYYFVSNKSFSLPENGDAPIIMIGPGTGIAPFRAFLQERQFRFDKGDAWLFFGDRNAASDFLYEGEIKAFLESGGLKRLDLAFSRDQQNKIYVQDRMRENGAEFFSWLDRGAYVFVCGDAEKMAKDVNAALHDIIRRHGRMTPDEAEAYVSDLKKHKRYVRDVY